MKNNNFNQRNGHHQMRGNRGGGHRYNNRNDDF